jgi:hypothetical protein
MLEVPPISYHEKMVLEYISYARPSSLPALTLSVAEDLARQMLVTRSGQTWIATGQGLSALSR